MSKNCERIGWSAILGLGAVVVAMMVLSLCVTATGTARFMAPMGYDIRVGYGVGAILELAKDLVPMALLALWMQRAHGLAVALGAAWICSATFSCLATHSTVVTAVSSVERMGTWKMEARVNSKAELAAIEQQLATLSRPTPPRPVKTVREALAAERVPPSVWQDSNECAKIHDSAHFAKACAQVVQLRGELAASEDYERLSVKATEMREALAEVPIVATADPLPSAFRATLGQLLPLGGTEGVALLLTIVVELISGFGPAAIRTLWCARKQLQRSGTPAEGSLVVLAGEAVASAGTSQWASRQAPSPSQEVILPNPSLRAIPSRRASQQKVSGREASNAPSNVLPMRPRTPPGPPPEGGSLSLPSQTSGDLPKERSHVLAFDQQRLQRTKGVSAPAKELRAAYEDWCTAQGFKPLSVPKFSAELKRLGCGKYKSCGRMRYRDLELIAPGAHTVAHV
jgi:hypothetical protein